MSNSMFCLINKNHLIPKITKYENKISGFKGLHEETDARSNEYNKNVYLLMETDLNLIYVSDNSHIYSIDLKQGLKKIVCTYNKVKYSNVEYSLIPTLSTTMASTMESTMESTSTASTVSNSDSNDMNLIFNDKKMHNVKFNDDAKTFLNVNSTNTTNAINTYSDINCDTKTNIKINEKMSNGDDCDDCDDGINNDKSCVNIDEKTNPQREEILKMIEEVNDLYLKELFKIKKLESNLKIFDSKLKKLQKIKRDETINEIIRTQSEYRTWKKIKYGLKDDDEDILKPVEELEESTDVVPILFLSKFNYIEKIQNNEAIKKLFIAINDLDLNELYSSNELPDETIIQFCNKYMKLSKELHYHFDDHEWSYLENEMNLNSTNKLGSNVVKSKKIE